MSSKKNKNASCPMMKTSIGGQALMEGIMMRGPQTTAMAVRNPKGEIVLEKFPTSTKKRSVLYRIPIIRGIFNFGSSMALGYKCLMRSAEISGIEEAEAELEREKREKKAQKAAKKVAKRGPPVPEVSPEEKSDEKSAKKSSPMVTLVMVISVILAIAIAVGLFFVLPVWLYSLLGKLIPGIAENRFIMSAFEGVVRVLLLIGYMVAVSLMKDIRRTYMYHGAEHKTIFCYESGLELTVENVRNERRFHPRCGTSFLVLMVFVSIIVGFFIPPAIPKIWRSLIKVALIPVIVGLGYELIKICGKYDNKLTRIIAAPGLAFQRLTVFEPTDDMIECAIAAMKEVIPEDGSDKV